MSELEWIEESSLLTEQEWDRIIAWHRKRMGRFVTFAQFPILIDPVLPDDTIKIGDVTLTNIQNNGRGDPS